MAYREEARSLRRFRSRNRIGLGHLRRFVEDDLPALPEEIPNLLQPSGVHEKVRSEFCGHEA